MREGVIAPVVTAPFSVFHVKQSETDAPQTETPSLMTHVIAITNQKGGVGKTTTTVNLAACLAAANRRTLLVDMDPQGNATSGLDISKTGLKGSIYEVLINAVEPHEVIVQAPCHPTLHVLPATMNLVGAELELIDLPDRANRLALALNALASDYDYILIDSPPSLGLLTLNVLVYAQHILVPVQAEYYALEGLSALTQTIERVRNAHNPNLSLLGLALTMFDSRTNLNQQVMEEVQRVFGDKVFKSVIHRSVKLSEASSFGKPVIYYDLRSRGATNYMELCQEVVNRCESPAPVAEPPAPASEAP